MRHKNVIMDILIFIGLGALIAIPLLFSIGIDEYVIVITGVIGYVLMLVGIARHPHNMLIKFITFVFQKLSSIDPAVWLVMGVVMLIVGSIARQDAWSILLGLPGFTLVAIGLARAAEKFFANYLEQVDPTDRRKSTVSAKAQAKIERRVTISQAGVAAMRLDGSLERYHQGWVSTGEQYILPYVEIHSTHVVKGTPRFTYEILDDHERQLFRHDEDESIRQGLQLVFPAKRLSVGRLLDADEGMWQFRVSMNGTVIANYSFSWRAEDTVQLVEDDGEITARLREAIDAASVETVSLDELMIGLETTPKDREAS